MTLHRCPTSTRTGAAGDGENGRHVRLDHLSYAAGPEGLGACAQRHRRRHSVPVSATAGCTRGSAPATSCCRWPDGVYLEVVAALDHPAADKAPFGQAVKARTEAGGGWLAWVVAVDDIAPSSRGWAGRRSRVTGAVRTASS